MKQALYGISGGLVAGLLFLSILFLGPLSNRQDAAPVQSEPATVSSVVTSSAVATESASVSVVVSQSCSVKEFMEAEGILDLQAQVVDVSTSAVLLEEEMRLTLPSLTVTDALEIGEIAKFFGQDRSLPIAVEVRVGDWAVYHASLPGSTPENDWWIGRKARAVNLTCR